MKILAGRQLERLSWRIKLIIGMLLILLATSLYLGCGEKTLERIQTYKLFKAGPMHGKPEFEHPANWSPLLSYSSVTFRGPEIKGTESVIIMLSDISGPHRAQGKPLDKIVDMRLDDRESVYRYIGEIYRRPRQLAGIQGLEYSFCYHSVDQYTNTDVWGQTVATIIVRQGQAFELIYSGDGELFPKYYEVYERAIKTLKFTE